MNIISSADLWGLWELRNAYMFLESFSLDQFGEAAGKNTGKAQGWMILCPVKEKQVLEKTIAALRSLAADLIRLSG